MSICRPQQEPGLPQRAQELLQQAQELVQRAQDPAAAAVNANANANATPGHRHRYAQTVLGSLLVTDIGMLLGRSMYNQPVAAAVNAIATPGHRHRYAFLISKAGSGCQYKCLCHSRSQT